MAISLLKLQAIVRSGRRITLGADKLRKNAILRTNHVRELTWGQENAWKHLGRRRAPPWPVCGDAAIRELNNFRGLLAGNETRCNVTAEPLPS